MTVKHESGLGLNYGLVLTEDPVFQNFNDNFLKLGAVTQLTVIDDSLTTPPTLVNGAHYIVPVSATGIWASQVGNVAVAIEGQWVYYTPTEGWKAWVQSASVGSKLKVFTLGAWVILPAGGSTIALTGDVTGSGTSTVATTLAASGATAGTYVNPTLVIDAKGRVTSATKSAGLKVLEGSNAKQGVATLAAGTVSVANTAVTANSRIFLTIQDVNGGVPGAVYVSAKVATTSFDITSTSVADTSIVAYEIFEPA